MPRPTMWRAAAVATVKLVVTALATGCMTSPTRMSMSGVPWMSSLKVALKQTSMPPLWSATAAACRSTASRSTASRTATCAIPPSSLMRWATSSSVARVRQVRCTSASSRAYARAIRGADGATAPVDDRGAVLQQHHSSAFHVSRTRVKPRDVQPREIPDFIGTSCSGKVWFHSLRGVSGRWVSRSSHRTSGDHPGPCGWSAALTCSAADSATIDSPTQSME